MGRGDPRPPQGPLRDRPATRAEYWRAQSKAGEPVDARIINTSSGAGLMGSVGQGTYSAAKAGIAALTLVEAAEMARYGVTANAIAPAARTRMTEEVFADRMAAPDDGFDANHPGNVSPLVVWLGSTDSRGVTGRVFEVEGGIISVADGWQHGPQVDKGARWEPTDVGAAVRELLAQGPAARAGLRRAVAARVDPATAPSSAGAVARGRARGPTRRCSTGFAAADPTTRSRSSTGHAAHGRRPATRRRRATRRGLRQLGVRPGRRRRAGSSRTGGRPSCSAGRSGAAARSRARSHRRLRAARGRLHPATRPARASSRCRNGSAAPTTSRWCAARASTAS